MLSTCFRRSSVKCVRVAEGSSAESRACSCWQADVVSDGCQRLFTPFLCTRLVPFQPLFVSFVSRFIVFISSFLFFSHFLLPGILSGVCFSHCLLLVPLVLARTFPLFSCQSCRMSLAASCSMSLPSCPALLMSYADKGLLSPA